MTAKEELIAYIKAITTDQAAKVIERMPELLTAIRAAKRPDSKEAV